MRTRDFDFPLPQELIALEPAPERDASRLLVLHRDGGIKHRLFSDIVEFLLPGDMLLMNRTKVMPVRLSGRKRGGGTLDLILVRERSGNVWDIMATGKYTGELRISDRLTAHIERAEKGRSATLIYEGDLREILEEVGQMPLPPYIKRRPNSADKERYQTVYARDEGSIAAPTAGLHFTPGLLRALQDKGVLLRYLTLHVGKGTFIPIRSEALEDHSMEAESFEIPSSLVDEIAALGGRLITVGTTTTRAVEGLMSGRYQPAGSANGTIRGTTDVFIYPGYDFRVVSSVITNFHLPRSTPLMLASALCGCGVLMRAYAEAIRMEYRFFSYGDAMLIL